MKIFKQFLKEFWIQFLISLAWAFFSIRDIASDKNIYVEFIKYFGSCFFLTSWFGGQLLRIVKQQKLESNLDKITNRMEHVSDNLETVYKDIKGYAIGGDSFCYMDVRKLEEKYVIGLVHQGTYPLYDISFSFLNINSKDPKDEDITKRNYRDVGDLAPGIVKLIDDVSFDDNPDNYIKYKVNFYCRKGHFVQDIRIVKFEQRWYTATRVLEGNKEIFRKLHENYPLTDPFK